MSKLAVFTVSYKRPRQLARLLTNLLCQKMTDFKIYLGIQDMNDVLFYEVKQVIQVLKLKGIDVKVIYVPLSEGKFVSTKNRVLQSIEEPFAFYTDDDYLYEYDYLGTLINIMEENEGIGCISGTSVLTIEIPIDQSDAMPLDVKKRYRFCWVDDDDVLYWSVKVQRVNYPKE